MPRAKKPKDDKFKTSKELDAEIKELETLIAGKRKAKRAVKRREDEELERAMAAEEAKFNEEFVERAKAIFPSDYADDIRSAYEIIRDMIRPPEIITITTSGSEDGEREAAPGGGT